LEPNLERELCFGAKPRAGALIWSQTSSGSAFDVQNLERERMRSVEQSRAFRTFSDFSNQSASATEYLIYFRVFQFVYIYRWVIFQMVCLLSRTYLKASHDSPQTDIHFERSRNLHRTIRPLDLRVPCPSQAPFFGKSGNIV